MNRGNVPDRFSLLCEAVHDNVTVILLAAVPFAFRWWGWADVIVMDMLSIVVVVLAGMTVARRTSEYWQHLRQRDTYAQAEQGREEKQEKKHKAVQLRKVYTSVKELLAGVDNGTITDGDLATAGFALDCTAEALFQPGLTLALKSFVDECDWDVVHPGLFQANEGILRSIIQYQSAHTKVVRAILNAAHDDPTRVRWASPGYHYEVVPAKQ